LTNGLSIEEFGKVSVVSQGTKHTNANEASDGKGICFAQKFGNSAPLWAFDGASSLVSFLPVWLMKGA
jgi:hypothetical protein